MTPASWTGPVSNAAVAITFRQHIGRERRPAHRHLLQDADLHAQHHDPVGKSPAAPSCAAGITPHKPRWHGVLRPVVSRRGTRSRVVRAARGAHRRRAARTRGRGTRVAARPRRPRRLPELGRRGRLPAVAVHARRDRDGVHRRRPVRLRDVLLRRPRAGAQAQRDHRQARRRSTRRCRSTSRTASPSRPTASRSTRPTERGWSRSTATRPPARSPSVGLHRRRPQAPAPRRLRDGHRHQPRRQVRLRRDPPGQRDRHLRPRHADRRAHARPRPAGLRERARPPRRRRPGHGGRVRRRAGDASAIIDLTVGPGGTHVYTVSDQHDSIAVLTRNATTGPAHARGGRRAVRGARRAAGYWPDDRNPLVNEKVFDCKTANPHSEYLNGISFSPDGAQRLRRRPARHGRLHAQRRDRRADRDRRQGRLHAPTTRRPTTSATTHPNAKYARRVWVRPDGKRAYAAVGESAGVMTWDRDPATGGLRRSSARRAAPRCAPSASATTTRAPRRGTWPARGSRSAARTAGTSTPARSTTARSSPSGSCARPSAPDPVDFFVQEVGQTAAAKTVTVRNDGTDPMPISGVTHRRRGRDELRDRVEHLQRARSPPARLHGRRDVHADARRPTSTRRSTSPPRAARRARTRRR